MSDWKRMVFIDETKANHFFSYGSLLVLASKTKRILQIEELMRKTLKHRGGSVNGLRLHE